MAALVVKLRSVLEGAHIRTSVFVGPGPGRLKCAGVLAFAVPDDVRAWRALTSTLLNAGLGFGWAQVVLDHDHALDAIRNGAGEAAWLAVGEEPV